MIVFVRSYLCDYDARINKFFSSLDAKGHSYAFIGWARGGAIYEPHARKIIYRTDAPLGARWRNLFAMLMWQIFIFRTLLALRRRTLIVQCVDLDTALVGYFFCLLFGKKFVFDIYDQYSSSRGFTGLPACVMNRLETALTRRAALCIVAAPERLEQHCLDPVRDTPLVLENVPPLDLPPVPLPEFEDVVDIGFFGVLERQHRGIETLLALCDRHPGKVRLHIAGYGALQEMVALHAQSNPSVMFYGPLSSREGLELMQRMHVIAGLYHLSNPNHKYAAPNKYYEHLMLGRGLLTTRDTPPGKRVTRLRTGWALDEGLIPLERWLKHINVDELRDRAERARMIWNNQYQNYLQEYYMAHYEKRITELLREV